MPPIFIADVHLGKLARLLRMLGFDTVFESNLPRAGLLRTAHEEKRILLTRDRKLESNPFFTTLIICSEQPEAQLQQVVRHFGLHSQLAPFTRCLMCNTLLQPVNKEQIKENLEPKTRSAFQEFWQCAQCSRVYWKGSHYERMQRMIARFSRN